DEATEETHETTIQTIPIPPEPPPFDYALLGKIVAVVGVIASAIVAIVLMLRRLKRAEEDKFARWRGFGEGADIDEGTNRKRAAEMYRFMFRLLKSQGIDSVSGEPPSKYAERVDTRLCASNSPDTPDSGETPFTARLSEVMPAFTKLEFADENHTTLSQGEYDSIFDYVTALYDKTVRARNALERLSGRIKFRKL
ncbi:MAG: hypothetical protein FWG45_03090, partial [Oscillospiraceae bacterium]|nr:hypothetical protein [Oscillospiraceae bacterium]